MLNSVEKLYHEIRLGGKTKILLFTFFLFVSLDNISAQAPSIQWQKSLGGTDTDVARAIQQTTDGGYIVAGWSVSTDGDVTGNHGGNDCWIVKLRSTGNIQWQKSLGGSSEDEAFAIQQTSGGGYIVAGYTSSTDGDVTANHGGIDYWVVKLDTAGNIQWQKSLGGSSSDIASAIQQTTDGGYIIAGYSSSIDGDVTGNHIGSFDYWIVKLDSSGNIQWQKSLGGSDYDYAYAIQETADGGYIVAGKSFSYDGDVTGSHGLSSNWDYWIVKLSSSRNIQWQKSLGGSNGDIANAIQQTTDGGYIIAGYSSSTDGDVTGNHGNYDSWIVKLDSLGYIKWEKSLGGASGGDLANAVQQTTDGGYIVAGYSFSTDGDVIGNHGGDDYWIVKLDSTGNIQWQKSLGGSNTDVALAIQQTTDRGYIVAGVSSSTDGDVTGNHGDWDYWIVKLSPNVGIDELSVSENLFSIYPNPSNGTFTVSGLQFTDGTTINVFNTLGEMVYSQALNRKQETVNCKLNAGVYFVEVRDVEDPQGRKEKQYVQKLIIE